MKQLSRALLVLALAWSGAAMAASVGPVDDGRDHLGSGPVSKWIQTTWTSGKLSGNDLIHIKKNGDIDIYLQANMIITTPSSGPFVDAELTTIYGKQAPGSQLTGFDSSDGISFDSLEQHMGGSGSGQVFYSFAHESVAAIDLQSHFVGVDLSGFDTSSSTQTYELFRTTVPMAEILTAVPEPDTLALCLAGFACLGLGVRSKSKAKA